MKNDDTICSVSTPSGTGAISMVRLSGNDSITIAGKIWKNRGAKKSLMDLQDHYAYLGEIILEDSTVLDEAIMIIYRSPASYTTENMVEFSIHGSTFIQNELMQLLIRHGARTANAGEFTMRAFMNGRIDLAQAEAVADLISSGSQAAHKLAMQQMRGGFSNEITELREQLLHFSSLLELELDFSEEDIEFADRKKLMLLLEMINGRVEKLLDSFKFGNVLKSGIPVTIAGKPNVGKSTLLNILLNEDKAIVTDIPGTTRDALEDTMVINGLNFRFIDTAGLREASDIIENLGIEKTYKKIETASIVIYMFDISESQMEEIYNNISEFKQQFIGDEQKLIVVANKIDMLVESPRHLKQLMAFEPVYISAKRRENINILIERLLVFASEFTNAESGNVVTNSRHYESLHKVHTIIQCIKDGISSNLSSDLVAVDVRSALHHLAVITGSITSDDVLNNIFSKFCIGK